MYPFLSKDIVKKYYGGEKTPDNVIEQRNKTLKDQVFFPQLEDGIANPLLFEEETKPLDELLSGLRKIRVPRGRRKRVRPTSNK